MRSNSERAVKEELMPVVQVVEALQVVMEVLNGVRPSGYR